MKKAFYISQKLGLAMTAVAGTLALAWSAHAQSFLSAPCASATTTFACFQINVNPNFFWLMNPGNVPPDNQSYYGWASPDLTSPGMQDDPSSPPGQTLIGESAGLASQPSPTDYPILIGDPTGCGGSLYQYSIPNGNSYSFPGFGWAYAYGTPNPTTLTEIQYFTLTSEFSQSTGAGACPPGTSPLYPNTTPTPATSIYVKAGYQNFADPTRRSIGMIVSHDSSIPITSSSCFPAESFFDVYVEVTLPVLPGTVSGDGAGPTGPGADPVFPAGGALLINQSGNPLIVSTDPLSSFPTISTNGIFYVHTPATPAVPLVFENDNPNPYYPGDGSGKPFWWHKGDTFGWVQLAGHGIFVPCDPGFPSTAWTNFMTLILGTPGHKPPAAPVGGVFSGDQYPLPASTYRMTQGTNFGGQASDAITFSNATTISAAFLTLTNFQLPKVLPAFGSSMTYTNTNTVFNISWSLSGLANYVQDQSTGTVMVLISNTNPPVDGVTTYNTKLLQCSAAGVADFGQWALQLDPTQSNAGLHMVQALNPGGYRITGYFDARFQVSANNGVTWTESDAQNRLYLGDSPCGAAIEPIHCTRSGSNIIIDWANPSYSLEGSPSINPAVWSPIVAGSPAVLPINTPYKFFRLSCD
jgi:hypothetical protein